MTYEHTQSENKNIDHAIPEKLQQAFEMQAIDNGEPATNVGGFAYLMSKVYVQLDHSFDIDEETTRDTAASLALNRLRGASTSIHQQFGDIFTDKSKSRSAMQALSSSYSNFNKPSRDFERKADSLSEEEIFIEFASPELFEHNLASVIIQASSGDQKSITGAQLTAEAQLAALPQLEADASDNEKKYYNLRSQAMASYSRLLKYAAADPNGTRRQIGRLMKFVENEEFDSLQEASTPNSDQELEEIREFVLNRIRNEELPFTIFPEGTDLRELSENIYKESTDTEKSYVDLKRLKLLSEVRDLVGEDNCYLARGIRSGKTQPDSRGGNIDEDYIILVMQHHAEDGTVDSEDALAVSPIAGKHAAYLARHDTSGGMSWRDLFQLTKEDAQDLGARRLKFTSPQGNDLIETMQEKIYTLLTCPADQFKDKFEQRGNAYKLVKTSRSLGSRALWLNNTPQ